MTRGLTLGLAALVAASCSFDSSGLRADARRGDWRAPDRPPAADRAADLSPPTDGAQPVEARPPDTAKQDQPPPARCSAWADWECSEFAWGCSATCDDGKAPRTVECDTFECRCMIGTSKSGCAYKYGWGCGRCEDALNAGCCRP